MNKVLDNISALFPVAQIVRKTENMAFFTTTKEMLPFIASYLKEKEGFGHLVLLTAVDWIEDNLFQLTYILRNHEAKIDLGVRVMLDRGNPVMDSVHHLWITAATYQRELKEMFGIDFPGSPRLDEPFVLEGWHDIPPYRRDFDTKKYSEETYFPRPGRVTHDPEEWMKEKLYPGEENND